MTRAISIVLIAAMSLQTVGCSTWRPLARANAVAEDSGQSPMRDQVLGKLKEGMRARIKIRESTRAPVVGQVIECVVEKVGPTSLTVIPSAKSVSPDNVGRKLTLNYSDIESIEYRESKRGFGGFGAFVAGLGVGVALGVLLFSWAISGLELD